MVGAGRKLIRENTLPAFRIGRRWAARKSSLRAAIEAEEAGDRAA